MNRTKPIYETPLVRVEAVSTEHGFAGSRDGLSNFEVGKNVYDQSEGWN